MGGIFSGRDEKTRAATLYVMKPHSHYCDAAAWALQASRTPYTERGLLCGLHLLGPMARIRGGQQQSTAKGSSLPLLVAHDGKVLGDDSWEILKLRGEIPARAFELLEQVVGPATRAVYYSHYFSTPETTALFAQRCQRSPETPAWQRYLFFTPFGDKVFAAMARSMVPDESFVMAERTKLLRAVEELEDKFLGKPPFVLDATDDGGPSAAAIATAALISPVVRESEPTPASLLAEYAQWRDRPIGRFCTAMYEKYPH